MATSHLIAIENIEKWRLRAMVPQIVLHYADAAPLFFS
jgi:hypothetical protein